MRSETQSKPCSKCGEGKRRADHSWCRDCLNEKCRQWHQKKRLDPEWRAKAAEKTREWYRENRDYALARDWNKHLVRKFGISAEQYEEMLSRQGGVCAICERACPSGNRLATDHHHGTGRVRGLLCRSCNRGIGQFGDDPDLLRKAAEYLD